MQRARGGDGQLVDTRLLNVTASTKCDAQHSTRRDIYPLHVRAKTTANEDQELNKWRLPKVNCAVILLHFINIFM